MITDEFKNEMSEQREAISDLVSKAAGVKASIQNAEAVEGQDKGEMIANVMLAIRHLEDAAMRFGKAIQASDGGVSPLGGPNTPGQETPQGGDTPAAEAPASE